MAEALEALYPNVKLGIGLAKWAGILLWYRLRRGENYGFGRFSCYWEKNGRISIKEQHLWAFLKSINKKLFDISRKKPTHINWSYYKIWTMAKLPFISRAILRISVVAHIFQIQAIWRSLKLLNMARITGVEMRKILWWHDCMESHFPKQAELDAYLTMLEEAKRRDHRKIGKELSLFTLMIWWVKDCHYGCPMEALW